MGPTAQAPLWVVEGAAVYLEFAQLVDGVMTVGGVDDNAWLREYRDDLAKDRALSVYDITRIKTGAQWRSGNIFGNYRGAGALVHFLMRFDDGRYRSDFVDLLREAYAGGDPRLEDFFGLNVHSIENLMRRFYGR